MLRIAIALSLLVVVLPSSVASAAGPPRAKFEATFEASRKIQWQQPRGVSLIDCKGEHFYEADGSETWTMKTAKPQKVLVTGGIGGGMTMWTYGSWDAMSPKPQIGIEVAGMRKRELRESSGVTGGWCNPLHTVDPPVKTDCGTRLPAHHVRFSNMAGVLLWTQTEVPWMHREKLGFDDCVLVMPDGVEEGDFPKVTKKLANGALFNRRQKKIVVSGTKTFGPTAYPVPNLGVDRTSTATVTWKLTLVRKK